MKMLDLLFIVSLVGTGVQLIKEACEQSRRQVLPEMGNYINVKDIKLDAENPFDLFIKFIVSVNKIM